MLTQEEKSRVVVHGTVYDLTKVGKTRLSAKDVQILAEAGILLHLERDEALEAMVKQIETLQKQTHCEHAKPDWALRVGPPRGSGSSSCTVYRTVSCICLRCGKKLFEKSAEEDNSA